MPSVWVQPGGVMLATREGVSCPSGVIAATCHGKVVPKAGWILGICPILAAFHCKPFILGLVSRVQELCGGCWKTRSSPVGHGVL